ncbi:hypothetical protein [Roseateles sp.]|uniref:hypothetical protein n=1 Tax=Roseateles sp. TaxID=1971397 RepID=UPI0032679B21
MKSALKFVLAYVLLSCLLGGLSLIQSFPALPTSWLGWLLMFVLVIPITLAGEFLGEVLFRNPVSQFVERRTKHRQFSWLRVLVALAGMLVALGAVLGLGHLISSNGWSIF